MFNSDIAVSLMADMAASTPNINYLPSSTSGNLVRDGRGDIDPSRHVWTKAVCGTQGIILSYRENREQRWLVGIGEVRAKSGKFVSKANVKEFMFSNFFEAANFFVNEACPAAKIYS